MADAPPCPDGIVERHINGDTGLQRHASPLSILILGGLLALALAGVFGGGRSPIHRVTAPGADLSVATPTTLRNGIFFETRIVAVARRDLKDATIVLPPSLWRDLTINSMIPAAGKESFEDGAFRFGYGPLKAGETLTVKVDGQVNPPLTVGLKGDVGLYDGKTPVASVPMSLRVLP